MKKIINFILENRISICIFLLVGTLTACLYFSLFGLLWHVLGIDYRIGVTTAYILSTTFHFMANRHLTFKGQDGHLPNQVMKYLSMVGINYLTTLLVVSIVVEQFKLSPYLGIFLAIGVTMIMTYIMSYFWIFKSPLKYSRR